MQLMDGSLESQSVGWKVDKYIVYVLASKVTLAKLDIILPLRQIKKIKNKSSYIKIMFDPIQTPPEPPKIKYQIRISKFEFSKFNFQNSIFKIRFSKFKFSKFNFQKNSKINF